MTVPDPSTAVTRIARRMAKPGHEREYEHLVREMFALMKKHRGFRGGELIPPAQPGEPYQVVVNYATEADLAAWDNSSDRNHILGRMRQHAESEPEHRRLDVLEEWFVGPSVPASVHPPRWKTAVVTWMGIWPLASIVIWLLTPVWERMGLPFLLITAINVVFIVVFMTFLVAPVLTRLMKWFLVPGVGK